MKNSIKFTTELQVVPALGLFITYAKLEGLIILIGCFSMTIKRVKKKRYLNEPVKSRHQVIDSKTERDAKQYERKYKKQIDDIVSKF